MKQINLCVKWPYQQFQAWKMNSDPRKSPLILKPESTLVKSQSVCLFIASCFWFVLFFHSSRLNILWRKCERLISWHYIDLGIARWFLGNSKWLLRSCSKSQAKRVHSQASSLYILACSEKEYLLQKWLRYDLII